MSLAKRIESEIKEFLNERRQAENYIIPAIISSDGTILDMDFTDRLVPSHHHITAFLKLLQQEKRLDRIFDTHGWEAAVQETLQKGGSAGAFPLQKKFLNRFVDFHGYSLLSDHFCAIRRFDDQKFLALIYVNSNTPPMNDLADPALFFDKDGTILAFNFNFFLLISDMISDPHGLLGKNLSPLVVEAPETLELRMAARRREALFEFPGQWKPFAISPEEFIVSAPETRDSNAREFLTFSNSRKDIILCTCPRELPYQPDTVILDFLYRGSNGRPPLIMLGLKGFSEQNFLTPDQAGISLGPDATGNRLLLKRMGSLLGSAPLPALPPGQKHSVRLALGRDFLFLSINDKVVFSFCNHMDFAVHRKFLNFGVRPGEETELSGIRIESIPWRAPAPDNPEGVLRFRHLPDRYFSYYYYANPRLKPATAGLRGIVLHEITALHRRIEYQEQKSRELQARLELAGPQNAFIGNSAATRKVVEYAQAVARTRIPILLQGPTGSGKGVLAAYVHAHSLAASGPFVKMDCSTIPHELFESIVFGHVKGAFTGAHADSPGLLEKGNRGTVLIDEIQNLMPEDQAKLLHVLQEYTITPVGSSRAIRLDVRFIIAANEDLESKAREGKFRQDLFYRINTMVIRLPALKDRLEDIPDLCAAFIRQYNAESGKSIDGLDAQCYPMLSGHAWPGNVRELKNVITHACLFTPGSVVSADTVKQYLYDAGRTGMVSNNIPFEGGEGVGRISKTQFVALLKKHRGRAVRVARDMGITRNTVYYNLKRFGLKLSDYKLD